MAGKMIRVTLVKPEEFVIEEAEKPTPGKGEVLIRVKRCGVCGSDSAIYHGKHPYAISPLVMGHEFAGVVEELGPDISCPEKGTRVTVIPHLVCGKCNPCREELFNFCQDLRCMGAEANGAHADYVNVPANMAISLPDSVSLDDGALIEPASVGYHGAKRGDIKPDDRVLVIGAGPIGIFTMQSCKALGAGQVHVADLDEWKLELASKLGADGTVNVSNEDLEEGLKKLVGGSKEIDVFYDCVGQKGKVFDQILQLARRGSRVVIIGVLQNQFTIPHLPDFIQHELSLSGTTMYVPQDYRDVIGFMGEGAIKTEGMITHYFSLRDIKKVFDMIDSGEERFFKVMFKIDE